MPDYIL